MELCEIAMQELILGVWRKQKCAFRKLYTTMVKLWFKGFFLIKNAFYRIIYRAFS